MEIGQHMLVAVFTRIPCLVVLKDSSDQEVEPRDIYLDRISTNCVGSHYRHALAVSLPSFFLRYRWRRCVFAGIDLVSFAFSTSVCSDAVFAGQRRRLNSAFS